MNYSYLTHALTEIGPKLDPVHISEDEDGMTYSLIFPTGLRVLIERDENRETLVFVGELGMARDEAETQKLCMFLMQFNSVWNTSGGLWFGCAEGCVFQLFWDVPYCPLDAETLGANIISFVERSEYWRDLVGRGAPNPDDSPEPPENPETMIRV